MSDLLQDTDLAREPVKEPAKAWRNWYEALCAHADRRARYQPGDKYHGARSWPSKDLAESAAAEISSDPKYPHGKGWTKYLGAYPEGQRP